MFGRAEHRNEIRTETACHTISIEACQAYKSFAHVYHYATQKLGVAPSARIMVAVHVWDAVGAQSAGCNSALITSAGNAPLTVLGHPNRISSFPIQKHSGAGCSHQKPCHERQTTTIGLCGSHRRRHCRNHSFTAR
jgi:hypothetical protein